VEQSIMRRVLMPILAVTAAMLFCRLPAAATSGESAAAGLIQQPQFSSRTDLVVLNLSVRDRKGAYVPALTADAFEVLENQQVQPIQFFITQDAPVTVGLLIDSSGSMFGNRDLVIAAAASFAENSNPDDEIFALSFSDAVSAVLPQSEPFTSDPDVLRRAMTTSITPHGRTALYDAVVAGLDYLERGTRERKVLVIVSDGGDNASRTTAEQVLRQTQGSNVVVYSVGLVDELARRGKESQRRKIDKGKEMVR